MLIERMQTNPEDFHYDGKLYRMTEQVQMSARDKKAYDAAHDLYLLEPALMVRVLETLMAPPEEKEEKVTYKAQGRYGFGINDHQLQGTEVWIDENTNTVKAQSTRELYKAHIQTPRDRKAKPPSKVTEQNLLSEIYNKAFGRERIERDN
jgi:hypothetical protein